MKLILGSAQISDDYGISNKKKSINKGDIEKIFKFKKNKKYIDTANSYNNSLETISKYCRKYKLVINLKINLGKTKKFQKKFFLRINDSFSKLNLRKLHSIMIHDTNNFLKLDKKNKKEIIDGIKKLKDQKKIKKYGFSIYNKKELVELKKINDFDIIQFPGNIFDQDILKNNNLNFFKKKKVELHVRSIFLQGLVFLTFGKAKKITNVNSQKLKKFYNTFKNNKERLYHCINFIKNQSNVDRIVVGFTSYKEFREINKILEQKLQKKNYSEFEVKNHNITKPYLWKKI